MKTESWKSAKKCVIKWKFKSEEVKNYVSKINLTKKHVVES